MDQIIEQQWDYIIVGTGMGGATLGHSLARSGSSVLFLEKGRSNLASLPEETPPSADDYAENFFAHRAAPSVQEADILASAGRYSSEIDDITGGKQRAFIPFIGSGTGGSTALYGMALERFFAADFTPGQFHAPAEGSSVPDAWPVTLSELLPHYRDAEQLFHVRGADDPLRATADFDYLPTAPLSPPNQALRDFLANKGLHPYQLPMACEQLTDCRTCQSFLCSKGCKNDSGRICLEPAIAEYGAKLLSQCEVLRVEASSSSVSRLVCRHQGRELRLQAHNYVIAAGALETPRLLLNSANADWPEGLANRSGLVGRNLMRHYIDLYALFTGQAIERDSRVKELAFNDLYQNDGVKLGSVQSFGFLPPAPILVEEMTADLRHQGGPLAAGLFTLIKPLARFGLKQLFSRALILATTMEDLPYEDNRVTLSEKKDQAGRRRLQLHYAISEAEQTRIDSMRAAMKDLLHPKRYMLLKQADSNQRIAHVCGTCRFGDDPASSVCDSNHKAHGLSNLYIADSSVFPSSGGINPSLTIAALSLRLAQHLQGTTHE